MIKRLKILDYIIKINKAKIEYKSKITLADKIIANTLLNLIPKKITPNKITVFRFFTIPIIMYCLIKNQFGIAIFLFIISASSDFVDGALARTTKQITSWGAIYDPIADKLLISSVAIILITKFISFRLGITIILIEITLIFLVLCTFKGRLVPSKLFGKLKMIFYSLGLSLLILYSLYNNFTIFLISRASIYFGIAFAILSPTLYLKEIREARVYSN